MSPAITLNWFFALLCAVVLLFCLILLGKRAITAYHSSLHSTLHRDLGVLFRPEHPKFWLRLHWISVACFALLATFLTKQIVVAFITALILGLLPRVVLRLLKRRRLNRFREQSADVFALIAAGLRAGSSLPQMLGQVALRVPEPAGQEFDLLVRQMKMGTSLDQCLRDLAYRMPSEEIRLFHSALTLGAKTGGSLGEVLDVLAHTTRTKLAVEGKIDALTAQGRMQAWVMGLMPTVVGFLLYLIDPDNMSKLFTTPLGWSVVTIVVVFQLVGSHMIRRIIAIDV